MSMLRFEIWGSLPDCDTINKLTSEELVQKVLFCLRKQTRLLEELAEELGADNEAIGSILKQLQHHRLVSHRPEGWLAEIGIFSQEDIRIAQELGRRYGALEATILADAASGVRDAYDKCSVAATFPWNSVATIIVGGIISDICVLDRVPFRKPFLNDLLLPPLHADGSRWDYVGYELTGDRIYPNLKRSYYHNVQKDSRGGFARWGCFGEARPRPRQPEVLMFSAGALDALSQLVPTSAPQQKDLKHNQFGLAPADRLQAVLGDCTPPAVVIEDGQSHLAFPMFEQDDLASLLSIGDQVAEVIHTSVTLPYLHERMKASEKLGLSTILPGGVLAREFALQRLAEDGIVPPPSRAPVQWNTGVWGWFGPLQMWEEVSA
jgi:hypothetical protein